MRRENSLALRDTSRDPKATSKVKRRKNGHLLNVDRKMENIPINNLQEQDTRLRTSHRLKEPLEDKLKMIGKCLQKALNKKQLDQYFKLGKWIEKEFSIRCSLEDQQMEGNVPKVKELKGFLGRIIEKQDELAKQWVSLLTQYPLTHGSGVFGSDIIAREVSPKHKFIGFATLEKKQSQNDFNAQYLQEEIAKKNQIIRGLFEKIDKLGLNANIQQEKITFGKCYETISAKLLKSQQELSRAHELELDIERQSQQMRATVEENNLLKSENAKLYEDLSMAEQERQRLQKKYGDLNEEFEELVGEKIQIEINQSKRRKEFESAMQNYKRLVARNKLRMQEILKEELQQVKNLHQYDRYCVQEELALLWSLIEDQVQTIATQVRCQLEEQCERLSERCFNLERRYKELEAEYVDTRSQNQRLQQCLRQNKMKEQSRRRRLQYHNNLNEHAIKLTTQKEFRNRIFNFDIFMRETQKIEPTLRQESSQTELIREIKLSLESIEIFLSESFRQASCNLSTQTSQPAVFEQSNQTEGPKTIDTMVASRQPNLFHNSTVVNLIVQNKVQASTTGIISEMGIYEVIKFQYFPNTQNKSQQTEQQPPQFQPQRSGQQELASDEEADLADHAILRMLKEADDCLLVSQVSILREEVARFKDQVDKMRFKIRQLEKEKEEESVFNFRL